MPPKRKTQPVDPEPASAPGMPPDEPAPAQAIAEGPMAGRPSCQAPTDYQGLCGRTQAEVEAEHGPDGLCPKDQHRAYCHIAPPTRYFRARGQGSPRFEVHRDEGAPLVFEFQPGLTLWTSDPKAAAALAADPAIEEVPGP